MAFFLNKKRKTKCYVVKIKNNNCSNDFHLGSFVLNWTRNYYEKNEWVIPENGLKSEIDKRN